MIKMLLRNDPIKVNTGDWECNDSNVCYRGKYTVGTFSLGYTFMLQYMHLIHNLPIEIDDIQDEFSNFTTLENTIMYMEHYGIIDNAILMNMRNMVKNPQNGFIVWRIENTITGICKDNTDGLE